METKLNISVVAATINIALVVTLLAKYPLITLCVLAYIALVHER